MGNKARDMLKLIPNVKLDVVERCAGHGGTFGVMKETHDLANKVGLSPDDLNLSVNSLFLFILFIIVLNYFYIIIQ